MGELVYIGAESCVSPFGSSAEDAYQKMLSGTSAIERFHGKGWKGSDVCLSQISLLPSQARFSTLLLMGASETCMGWDASLLASKDTLLILSSTKGDVTDSIRSPFLEVTSELVRLFSLKNPPLVLSNACVSGVLAINLASDLLKAKRYRHVVVLGCDVVSQFILYGFQALYAVSDEPCRPFDGNRKGVTLGEGCGGVILSLEKSVFKAEPLVFLGGSDANDANHISGPSRTGEGLVRAVDKAMDKAKISISEIGYINAHGTGTSFNDEMESIAFRRLGLSDVPLNSFKGYWGHTLGAAGVMETAACMQALKTGLLCASKGFEIPGTSAPLNVLTEVQSLRSDIILKTASGFGGGNAALLLKKI
jgi:3-oxoacyl-[acyl-carrier-protein] synthase-1